MDVMEEMGLPYVPFTFPTVTVQQNAKRAGVELTSGEIDRIWPAYLAAETEEGLAPFSHDMGGDKLLPLLQSLEKRTSLARGKIVAWLNALEQATKDGWYAYYIDPVGSMNADKTAVSGVTGSVGKAIGDFLKPSAEPVTNLIKWTAIAVVGGAVIYGLWSAAPFIKSLGRKRKRKG